MSPTTAADVLRELLPDDVATLDTQQVSERLRSVRTCRGWLDAYEATLTRRIGQLNTEGASAPPADLHTRDGGISSKEAKQKERRAKALEAAPSVADKLAAGECTASHADALADVTSRLDEQTRAEFFGHQEWIAADAGRCTPEEFAKNCRDLLRGIERDQGLARDQRQRRDTRVTTTIDRDGMYVLNARMHPELGHAVFNALDLETAKLVKEGGDRSVDRATVAADALGNLVTGGHQAVRPREAEIRLHIDEARLTDPDAGGVCEYDDGTPIPVPSVRRLICNGHIIPIILRPDGTAIDVGRTQRIANRTQRRALRAMYPTCAFHGCNVTFNRCEIHHIEYFELGGTTDLENLLPLCSRHHHLVHDLGWTLELDHHRTLTIRDQHGEIHAVVPIPTNRAGIIPTTRTQPTGPPGTSPPRAERPPDRPSGRPPDRPADQLTLIA